MPSGANTTTPRPRTSHPFPPPAATLPSPPTGERQWMPARLRTAMSRPIVSLAERSWGGEEAGRGWGAPVRRAGTPATSDGSRHSRDVMCITQTSRLPQPCPPAAPAYQQVVPKHAGGARVRQDVRVALLNGVVWEAPVALAGALRGGGGRAGTSKRVRRGGGSLAVQPHHKPVQAHSSWAAPPLATPGRHVNS